MNALRGPIRNALRAPLEPAQVARLWHGVELRRRRLRHARQARRGLLALAAAAAMALAWFRIASPSPSTWIAIQASRTPPAVPPSVLQAADGSALAPLELADDAPPHTLALSDGTQITLGQGAKLVPRLSTAARFEAEVARGHARFEVKPQGARRFVVHAGAVQVEVVGTVFSVEASAQDVEVAVERGRVRVREAGASERVLEAGQTYRSIAAASQLPPTTPAPPASPLSTPAVTPAPRTSPVPLAGPDLARAPSPSAADAVRQALARGDLAGAYARLRERGFERALERAASPEAVLELADMARAAGEPEAAAKAFTQLLRRYPRDHRCALAALTLARIQLDALAQPAAAARSLERALTLGLPEALREDAQARLVEARARALDDAGARRAADDYRRRFPSGRWRRSVEQAVGAP